jgi:hypothetical protein
MTHLTVSSKNLIRAKKAPPLPFDLEEQEDPLLPNQDLTLLHASDLEINTTIVEQVEIAFATFQGKAPQPPIHDTAPLNPIEEMEG